MALLLGGLLAPVVVIQLGGLRPGAGALGLALGQLALALAEGVLVLPALAHPRFGLATCLAGRLLALPGAVVVGPGLPFRLLSPAPRPADRAAGAFRLMEVPRHA